tara:strand:- start:1027 stop:1548 length:522 start_codon:yes stop_codon:yes gene_type:complete
MGRDKALIEVDGVACIARVASTLAAAGCEPIRIAVAQPEDVERYGAVIPDELDVEWVLDSVAHSGPIEAVIEALSDPLVTDVDSIQLCPVDVPWVTADLFFELENSLGSGDLLAIPADPQRTHPLLARVRPTVASTIGGDRRPLHVQFSEMEHSTLLTETAILRNINTPDDLN